MNSTYLHRVIALLVVIPLAVSAQIPRGRGVVQLRNWAAPLYWQPAQREVQNAAATLSSGAELAAASVASTPGAYAFVAMTPCRIMDTRGNSGFLTPFGPPSLAGNSTRTFSILTNTTCPVPPTARAYSFNVAVIPLQPVAFYVTLYPTGLAAPLAASVYSQNGDIVINETIVAAGTNGSVDVFSNYPTDLVIDINGYYAPQLTLLPGSAAAPSLSFEGDTGTGIFSAAPGTLNLATGGTNRVTVDGLGRVGIGAAAPGEKLHLGDGNVLIEGGGETALMFKRDVTYTGGPSGTSVNPIFKLGRVTQAGDHDPEFRLLYSDDTTADRSVFEVDRKGIAASVKQGVGSHFEGFISSTDPEPIFRLNSYPKMRLEMGSGGSTPVDVAVQREAPSTLTIITGGAERLRVDATGKVAIGTTTPRDTLEVNGEIRVADCVKNASGTQIAGSCPSDARLKTNIQPFSPVLEGLVQLQPVHFDWRAAEYPDYHFGTSRSYGLVAQEVERQFPELVSEDSRGFKAVNYSELPLLLLQAVRELKAENDILRQQLRTIQSR